MKLSINKEIPVESESSGKETINRYFESVDRLVKWDHLRDTLSLLDKKDIIAYIEKTFLYTKGIRIINFFNCILKSEFLAFINHLRAISYNILMFL